MEESESCRGLDDSRRVLANRSRALCEMLGSPLNRSTGSLTKTNSARLAGPSPRSLPQLMHRALDLRKAREEAYRSVHASMNEVFEGPPDIDLFVEQDSEALLPHLKPAGLKASGASSPLSQSSYESSMASNGNDGGAALVEQSGFLDHSSIDIQIQPQTNTRPLPYMNTRTQTWVEQSQSRFLDHSSIDMQRPNSVEQSCRTCDSSDTNQQASSRDALPELARSRDSSDTDLLLASLALTSEVSDEEGASEDCDMHPPPLLARSRGGARAGVEAGAGAGGGGIIASESTHCQSREASTVITTVVVTEGGSRGGTVAGCEEAVSREEEAASGRRGGGGGGWSVSAAVLSLCSRAARAAASQV
jgi:hypothetical protein